MWGGLWPLLPIGKLFWLLWNHQKNLRNVIWLKTPGWQRCNSYNWMIVFFRYWLKNCVQVEIHIQYVYCLKILDSFVWALETGRKAMFSDMFCSECK